MKIFFKNHNTVPISIGRFYFEIYLKVLEKIKGSKNDLPLERLNKALSNSNKTFTQKFNFRKT